MEHEKCYVFSSDRPAKRRRVDECGGQDSSWPLRERTYRELWVKQEQRIDEVIKSANETTLDEVSAFIHDARRDELAHVLPAGFLLAGPSIAAHALIFAQLQERTLEQDRSLFITVTSNDGLNLKTLLKAMIKAGISQGRRDEDELDLLPSRRSDRKLLDYDLQLLHDYVRENSIQQCIVVFRDCEAFDSAVLSEAIELISIWSNRIPFLLLFGIATSVDNLQDRLSERATRCLAGQQFDVVQSDEILESLFAAVTVDSNPHLWLGAELSNMLIQRQHDNLLNLQDFVDSVQYAYMSHFHANPLSIFLSEDLTKAEVSAEHFEALRNASSFRRYADECIEKSSDLEKLKNMIESDEVLFNTVIAAKGSIHKAMKYASQVILSVQAIQKQYLRGTTSISSLYAKAVSGVLNESPAIRELLLATKKMPSDVLSNSMAAMHEICPDDHRAELATITARLQALIQEDDSGQPMRSEHDIRSDTLRITVVAQKVQLSRHKAKLSEKDEAYSRIVTSFHDLLANIFRSLQNPLDMFGHEIALYDLRMPHRAALMPKPRFAIERALSSPHDYLNCQCCAGAATGKNGEEASLVASLPPTAALYRLYLESGSLINASDLWSAYAAVMECEDEDDKAKTMPSYQRALAELKYIGFVKSTRKKTDHIAKVAWKGL